MHETAYLNPGLTIIFKDLRKEEVEEITFHEPEGIVGFVKELNKNTETLHDVCHYKGSAENVEIEVAFQYSNDFTENILGFGNSFSTTIGYALADESCYDYFAFCDQDDYWMPDKIEHAVDTLSKKDQNTPLLFAHNYYICDENLHGTDTFCNGNPLNKVTFQNMFFEGVFPGFTIVINRTLAQLAFEKNAADDIFYHDKWVSLIALSLGNIIYDTAPLARYRRYEAAASSTNKGPVAKLKWRIDNVLNGNFCPRTQTMLTEYKRFFYDASATDIKEFLDIYTGNSKAAKLFYNHRLRRSLAGEILMRMIILLEK